MESLKFLFSFLVKRAFNQSDYIKRKYFDDNNFLDFVKKRHEFVSNIFNNYKIPSSNNDKPDNYNIKENTNIFKKEKTKDFINFIENKDNFTFDFWNKIENDKEIDKENDSIIIDFVDNDSLFADTKGNKQINIVRTDSEIKQKDIELFSELKQINIELL